MTHETSDNHWDVVVVGAGPAGASAARVAAENGARVLLLDKARFPRYKTCGGGLIGTSRNYFAPGVTYDVDRRINAVGFSRNMGRITRRFGPDASLAMVQRETFDQQNVDAAKAAGAEFRDGVNVRAVSENNGIVTLTTDKDTFTARVVVGADGSGGRIGRYVGVEIEQADLGLEAEIPMPTGEQWRTTALLDWGPRPGTYAWVFPKKDSLTVGVIEAKGNAPHTREYLDQWLSRLGMANTPPLHDSGHLTQWRRVGTPSARGHVIVAGETAGLLEPWTREGISFALRSGTWAGAAAAAFIGGDETALSGYSAQITRELEPEISAGSAFLRFFEKRSALVQLFTAHSRFGANYFFRFCNGETNLARAFRHSSVRRAVAMLSR
ncbi:geranylgeranyl reductase family protein [uncultured Microbacterium sp.]|uniref:geranylgeranyl reductase family protein n=1 Tax=uncultured Microbacterium sp. TaxID=191216 RepID=UPI0028D3F1B0|nr:geranylgeranyl reductase family protein [uncultured Microbacterium sp.]